MPETKLIQVYYEGDDDKAFLQKLRDARLLPEHWQLATRIRDTHPGKDGLIRQLIPFVSPTNGVDGKAVVLVDLDRNQHAQIMDWFKSELARFLSTDVVIEQHAENRVSRFTLTSNNRSGYVAVVPVGCPDDTALNQQYGITQFAIDDWTLRLLLNKNVYDSISEFKHIKYELMIKKFHEVAELFRSNGLSVHKGKTYLQILRALAEIGPASATITGRIVKKAIDVQGDEAFKLLVKPLLDDLLMADQLLASI